MSVCDLLQASMQAHNKAKPKGRTARPADWLDHLRTAATLRQEALEADPERASACWAEYGNHDAFMRFYGEKGLL